MVSYIFKVTQARVILEEVTSNKNISLSESQYTYLLGISCLIIGVKGPNLSGLFWVTMTFFLLQLVVHQEGKSRQELEGREAMDIYDNDK